MYHSRKITCDLDFQVILEGCGGLVSPGNTSPGWAFVAAVMVCGAAAGKTDVQHSELTAARTGFGFVSMAALNRRKQGLFYEKK